MDTKQWGGPGWSYLHTTAQNYDPKKHNPEDYRKFFHSVGKTLPCIHCRKSYQQFVKELPIEPFLKKAKGAAKWLYLIHNKVNKKLRDQGQNVAPDPTFKEVYDKYERFRVKNCDTGITCGITQNGGDSLRNPGTFSQKKSRCSGVSSTGSRCKRLVEGGTRCFQH